MDNMAKKLSWVQAQSWYDHMVDCPQSPKWHKEGNVWNHIILCCEKLLTLDEYRKLSPTEKTILEWATILHDVAKPYTTIIEDGELKTRNHSTKSSLMARQILMGIEAPFGIRENICNIIRWHMWPPRITSASDPIAHVVHTSCLCNNRLLYVLAKADSLGKISENKDSETAVEMWKEQCVNSGCFLNPYMFVNGKARYEFYQSKIFKPYYEPYVDNPPKVIMLSGIPGTGKTTYAGKQYPDLPLLELDMTREELGVQPGEDEGRVVSITKEKFRNYLRNKQSFVYGAVNHVRNRRATWIRLAVEYGAEVTIVYLEKPLDTVFKQNKSRDRVVPEGVILDMRSHLEVPNWDECHDLKFECPE